jgi:type II secretion system protein H
MRTQYSGLRGFTLVELIIVTSLVAIVAAMAIPLLSNAADSIRLGQSARSVERELQNARLQAVQTNQPIRVRFNCPVENQYRSVELVGTSSVPAAADNASDRCAQASYPYPSDGDRNPLTRPNHDGPLRYLDPTVSFSVVTTIEFWPDGTAHVDSAGTNPWPVIGATPTDITLARGSQTKTIQVNGIGKVKLQ